MLPASCSYTLRLDISPEVFQHLYSGQVSEVLATDVDGLRIRFPASWLRRFVTRDGIHGVFELEVSEDNRLLALKSKSNR
jgi:hypothetical protein